MSAQGREPERAAGATELLSASRFLEELRHVGRFRPAATVGDPLEAAVKRIERDPAFTQSRLLGRVLVALADQRGEFRRAEIAAFDSDTLRLVFALMDAYAAGTTTREQWRVAVDLADAARLGVGG